MERKVTIKPAKEHPENYKECEQISLGVTDIGCYLFRCADFPATEAGCGWDGEHKAYLIPWDSATMPLSYHYEEILRCHYWLKVYDDSSLTAEIFGDVITVYRAGGTFAIRVE